MPSGMGILMVLGAGVGALVIASKSASAATPSTRQPGGLTVGHQYKIVFTSDTTSRNAPSLGAMQQLAVSLAQLGWTRVTLTPDPTDPNLFRWMAQATWDGSKPALVDGLGVRFVSTLDMDAVAPIAPNTPSRYDAGMDQNTQTMVDRVLQSENDIPTLQGTADSLAALGYPIAAAAVYAKITALKALQVVNPPIQPQPKPGPSPVQPSIPPYVPPVPVPVPIPVPVFVPPVTPPYVPPAPASDFYVPSSPLPPLGVLPNGTYIVTAQHRTDQNQLYKWAQVHQAGAMKQSDIDGIIGQKTAKLTQLAQSWCNDTLGLDLDLDGLFGSATRAALAQAGYTP